MANGIQPAGGGTQNTAEPKAGLSYRQFAQWLAGAIFTTLLLSGVITWFLKAFIEDHFINTPVIEIEITSIKRMVSPDQKASLYDHKELHVLVPATLQLHHENKDVNVGNMISPVNMKDVYLGPNAGRNTTLGLGRSGVALPDFLLNVTMGDLNRLLVLAKKTDETLDREKRLTKEMIDEILFATSLRTKEGIKSRADLEKFVKNNIPLSPLSPVDPVTLMELRQSVVILKVLEKSLDDLAAYNADLEKAKKYAKELENGMQGHYLYRVDGIVTNSGKRATSMQKSALLKFGHETVSEVMTLKTQDADPPLFVGPNESKKFVLFSEVDKDDDPKVRKSLNQKWDGKSGYFKIIMIDSEWNPYHTKKASRFTDEPNDKEIFGKLRELAKNVEATK